MHPAHPLPPATLTVADAYDQAAAGYDQAYADPMHAAEDRWLRRWLGRRLPRDGLVADLGCGTGWLVDQLQLPPDRYVGLDISPGMLAAARAKHPRHRFLEADMAAVAQDRDLAAVVATWSLCYHPHPARVLTAAAAALAPGGVLLAVAYGPGWRQAACFDQAPGPPLRRLTPTALRWLAAAAGLEVEQVGGFRWSHPPRWPAAPAFLHRVWLPVEQATVHPRTAAYLLLSARRPPSSPSRSSFQASSARSPAS